MKLRTQSFVVFHQQTKLDYDAKLFQNYHEYTTSTNHVLKNEDAMAFSNFHEGFTLVL
jgi:hypothetical protein